MKFFTGIVIHFIFIAQYHFANSLDCYNCSNIQNVSSCLSLTVCQADHQCPTIDSKTTTVLPISIVGRAVTTLGCDKCCAVNACNKEICLTNEIQIDAKCADDPTFNCAQISAVFSICADRQHAKTVCRKYCGLCDLIDGAWSSWSAWSSCDVTCGDGTNKRLRMCNNPAPANGGLKCSGNSTDQRQCALGICPVHGGWSAWTGWGVCSVTCGQGLQRRERTCSNPYPSLFGNHCFGDNSAYNTCFSKACAAQHVAITVNSPNTTLVGNRSPIFTNFITNVGGGYSPSTGVFTCPVSGLYQFSVTVGAKESSSQNRVYCYIDHNGSYVGFVGSVAKPVGFGQGSETVYLELHVGDTVSLQCYGWQYVEHGYDTAFSGSLISN